MRKFRMWYGLALILVTSYAKRIVRVIGGSMKTCGRKLEHLGDDVTPQWSLKLFHKCYLAEAEIHLPGEVFSGLIEAIYQKYSGAESELVVKIKSVKRMQYFPPSAIKVEDKEFRLSGYGPPVVIKENSHDCVWTGYRNGYFVISFR